MEYSLKENNKVQLILNAVYFFKIFFLGFLKEVNNLDLKHFHTIIQQLQSTLVLCHKIIEVEFKYYAITYLLSLLTVFLFVCKNNSLKKPLVIRSNDRSP